MFNRDTNVAVSKRKQGKANFRQEDRYDDRPYKRPKQLALKRA